MENYLLKQIVYFCDGHSLLSAHRGFNYIWTTIHKTLTHYWGLDRGDFEIQTARGTWDSQRTLWVKTCCGSIIYLYLVSSNCNFIFYFSVYLHLCMCAWMFKHMYLLACVQYDAWRSKKNLWKLVLLSTMLLAWIKLRSTDFQKSTFTLGSSHQIFFFSFKQQYKQLK